MSSKSEILQSLLYKLESTLAEVVVMEHRFHPERRWRFDLAIPAMQVALEVQGGLYVKGKHVQGDGAEKDHEKLNEAQLMGWIVLQATPRGLKSPKLMALIMRACQRQRECLTDWMPEDRVAMVRQDEEAGEEAARCVVKNDLGRID